MTSAIWNFRLIAHHELNGFGGMGEGVSMQLAKDGRRILWCAHESAPKNFTGIDVTDPLNPRVVVQTDLPQKHMRSNSLETVGDIMAVAYQTKTVGLQPAGFELFDIAIPEQPRSIGFFDASGPYSRGCHQLWFCDGEYVHMASGAHDFQPHNPKDDQFYRIVDVRNPSKPTEVGRWWMPGQRVGDNAPQIKRHPQHQDTGFRAHNTNCYPQRPDRAYLGYIDGGMFILDITDKSLPRVIANWDNSPPYYGFTHTVLPMFGRDLFVVTDESVVDNAADWPKLVWILDGRDETNPVPIATCPMPPVADFRNRGGRFGAHNLHENVPLPTCWFSENIILATFFSGGLRAFDISDPYSPREVAHFVPEAPRNSPLGSIQINDVFVDDRGVVFCVDRAIGGLYILEMDF